MASPSSPTPRTRHASESPSPRGHRDTIPSSLATPSSPHCQDMAMLSQQQQQQQKEAGGPSWSSPQTKSPQSTQKRPAVTNLEDQQAAKRVKRQKSTSAKAAEQRGRAAAGRRRSSEVGQRRGDAGAARSSSEVGQRRDPVACGDAGAARFALVAATTTMANTSSPGRRTRHSSQTPSAHVHGDAAPSPACDAASSPTCDAAPSSLVAARAPQHQRGRFEPRTSWHKWGDLTTAPGLSFAMEGSISRCDQPVGHDMTWD